MKSTPKPYLSHSQMSALAYSEANYVKNYIWGVKREPNEFLTLGKRLAVALEHRETKEKPWIEAIKCQMPDYPIREHTIKAQISDIPLMGICDGFDNKKFEIGEYKTGLRKNLQGWTNQMTFYSLIIYQSEKRLPKKITLYWAETKFNEENQLIFSDKPVRKFDIKITLKDVIKFVPKIASTWKRIKLLVENERKIWGELPF